MKLRYFPGARFALVLFALVSFCGISRATLISYWGFDNGKGLARNAGSQGTLSVAPEGWLTQFSYPDGGTEINRYDCGQTSYEYLLIKDPISAFTDGQIIINNLDLTGYSNIELSFAEYISDWASLSFSRKVSGYIDGEKKWTTDFVIKKNEWTLTSIELPSLFDNAQNVRIDLEFYDLLNIDYKLHIDNIQLTGTPEPATVALLLAGACVCIVRRRRRK